MRTCIAVIAWLAAGAAWGADEVGMNTHLAPDDVYAAAADLGVGWVRLDGNWFQLQPAPDRFDWGPLDDAVQSARSRGLKVFLTLAYAPPWASSGDHDGVATNDVPQPGLYEAFVTAAVERYRDRVTHYGLWNEPNLGGFWEGSADDYVDRVLVPGADAIHRACPECKALGPELAGIGDWQSFLRTVLRRARAHVDVVTHHTYAKPQAVRPGWACDDFAHALDIGPDVVCLYKPGLRQILDEGGWQGEVWLTETGYQADPWDDADQQRKQADTVREILRLQLEKPWWTNTFFYEILDCRPVQPDCDIDGFGFLRRVAGPDDTWADDFVRKPAYDFLKGELADDPAWRAPDERPRVEAPRRADGHPDGDLGEWPADGCVALDHYEAQGAARSGAADLGARVCVAWTPDALWVAADVADDAHDNHRAPDRLWDGDSLQVALDPTGDARPGAGYDADDREWALALVGGAAQVAAYQGEVGGAEGAVRRAGDHTRYELRLPLAGLAAGATLRASFLVNDADGAGRDGWLEWTSGIGRSKDPAAFGAVVLAAGPLPDAGAPDAAVPVDAALPVDAARPVDAAPDGTPAVTDAGPAPDAVQAAPDAVRAAPDAAFATRADASAAAAHGSGGGCEATPAPAAPWLLALAAWAIRRRTARRRPGNRPHHRGGQVRPTCRWRTVETVSRLSRSPNAD